MTVLGFHASHEQVHPAALLEAVQHAEQVGFTAAMCSDHFSPWSVRQGHSAFAWSWLGAALQATDLPFGVVNAPGQRYHPAIIAQAAATLASMYPGRFWAALGTGEASNAAVDAYRGAGGTGPVALQVRLSWAPTEDEALAIAHDQWRSNVFPPDFNWDVDHVKHFDAAAEHVPPEALREPVLVSSDPAQHVAWLQELIALGFEYLHHVGKEQSAWLDVFGEQVLPQLDVTQKAAA